MLLIFSRVMNVVKNCTNNILSSLRSKNVSSCNVDYIYNFKNFRNISLKNNKSGFDRSALYYLAAVGVFMSGFGYKTGTSTKAEDARVSANVIETMKPVKDRKVKIKFEADTYSNMRWNFKPEQKSVTVVPGETALAFYSAKNPTDKPVIGIASYTVLPYEASKYFNKIQCFCFEEQRLNPHEEVELPVFFFLDPEFDDDPKLQWASEVVLHYTFFEAKKDRMMIPGISKPLEDISSHTKST